MQLGHFATFKCVPVAVAVPPTCFYKVQLQSDSGILIYFLLLLFSQTAVLKSELETLGICSRRVYIVFDEIFSAPLYFSYLLV